MSLPESPHTLDENKTKGISDSAENKIEENSSDSSYTSDDSSDNDSESEVDITERKDLPENLQSRVERLKAIRERLTKSVQENKRDVYKEHQRLRENPGEQRRQERKRREAEVLKQREEYTGTDYERSRFWEYSIERVEKYEEKKRKHEENAEHGFTDYAQVNRRKYERDVAKIKPDLAAYERQKQDKADLDAGMASISGTLSEEFKPEHRNIEKLAHAVEEQQQRRATLHKPSIEKEGEDVSYINERNARFNRKMNRAYDKYTKEIRDNFERGTAL